MRSSLDAPAVIVQQTTQKTETLVLLQDFNLHKICDLTTEALGALFEFEEVGFDLLTQEDFHFVVRELRF